MKQECLRLKVRDAIQEFLKGTVTLHTKGKQKHIDAVDLTCDLSDVVFDALEITEFEQDEYCNVRPMEGRST